MPRARMKTLPAIDWALVLPVLGIGFIVGLTVGMLIAPTENWWLAETRIAVNDQLMGAMSAHLGVPVDQITDLHLAFLLTAVLGRDHKDPGTETLKGAIDRTIDMRQPEPRRPGSTPR